MCQECIIYIGGFSQVILLPPLSIKPTLPPCANKGNYLQRARSPWAQTCCHVSALDFTSKSSNFSAAEAGADWIIGIQMD